MKNYEKIIKLIKEDKEIAENLFYFQEFREDVSLWTDPPRDGVNYSNMEWLFVTDQENFSLIGVNIIDETIWCIDDEGDFHQDCDALENLPYEIIRVECKFTKNKTSTSYFEKFKEEGYKETLERYEQWCKNNNIQLDKNKIYHDESGKLFDKYFELNK